MLILFAGRTWLLASIDYPEDRYKDAGRRKLCQGILDIEDQEASFCWCFWNLDIPVSELAESDDLIVRSMDEGLNVQQRDMYWNVMGMM